MRRIYIEIPRLTAAWRPVCHLIPDASYITYEKKKKKA